MTLNRKIKVFIEHIIFLSIKIKILIYLVQIVEIIS